jgi:hypothetical protein
MKFKCAIAALAALSSLGTVQAADIACTGGTGTLGGPSTGDATLGGVDAAACIVSGVNPQQGGGSTGLATIPAAWGTDFAIGDGYNSGGGSAYNSPTITSTFSLTNSKAGTWSLAGANGNYDIVVAMHYGGGSTFFLFDDIQLSSVALVGSWLQQGLNNGGQIADYSNFNIYFGAGEGGGTNVPLPGTLALLGIAAVGLARFRFKTKAV